MWIKHAIPGRPPVWWDMSELPGDAAQDQACQANETDLEKRNLEEALEWLLSASESVAVVGGSATDLKMARQYARDVLQHNKGEVRDDG